MIKKIQILLKHKHSLNDYNSAIELFEKGVSMYRISKNLNIPFSTIYEWCKYGVKRCKYGVKPRSFIYSDNPEIKEIITEMLEETTIIYDE